MKNTAAMANEDENINMAELFDIQCNAIDVELIDLVKERPPLYDPRVPQKDRTKAAREALWDEVCQSMQKKLKPLAAEMRWKYLRENYIKARKKQTLKEELAKETGVPLKTNKRNRKYPYRYHEQMLFLNNALDHQKMVKMGSTAKSSRHSSSRRSQNPLQHEQVILQTSTKSKMSNDSEESTMEIDALYDHQYEAVAIPTDPHKNEPDLSLNSSTVETKSSSAKNGCINYEQLFLNYLHKTAEKPTPIDGFLARLGEGLKRLPYRERSKLELEFLTRLNQVENELGLLS